MWTRRSVKYNTLNGPSHSHSGNHWQAGKGHQERCRATLAPTFPLHVREEAGGGSDSGDGGGGGDGAGCCWRRATAMVKKWTPGPYRERRTATACYEIRAPTTRDKYRVKTWRNVNSLWRVRVGGSEFPSEDRSVGQFFVVIVVVGHGIIISFTAAPRAGDSSHSHHLKTTPIQRLVSLLFCGILDKTFLFHLTPANHLRFLGSSARLTINQMPR
jgi:hypothetical protein